jgi:hypothetical protein
MADKQERTMRWDRAARLLTLTCKRSTERYTVQAIRDEAGEVVLGYRLTKASDGEVYDVDIKEGACHCLGFLRWQKPCKHIASLSRLRELRLIER